MLGRLVEQLVALALVLARFVGEYGDRVIHRHRTSVLVLHLSLDHPYLPRNAINFAKWMVFLWKCKSPTFYRIRKILLPNV